MKLRSIDITPARLSRNKLHSALAYSQCWGPSLLSFFLSKNPFLVHVWNTWACYIKNLLVQTCKQANKKARVQIVRLLYFADLHGGYKQIGPFRFFVVVPLHRQKTKTRSAATGVFRAATECGCGPTKGSEFPTRDGGQSKIAAKPPLSCRWVAKCGCGCKDVWWLK